MIAIQIEGRNALENIDAILEIKEVDIVFIRIYDLSKSLGILGQVDSPRIFTFMDELVSKILNARKYPGTIVINEPQLEKFLGLEIEYTTYSVDCEMLESVVYLKRYKPGQTKELNNAATFKKWSL